MNLKRYIVLLIFVMFLSRGYSQENPNILILTIEDMSQYLLPMYGNTHIDMPNLEFLASEGVIFDNAFANAPHCSPARSSLIAGSPATVHGTDLHRSKRHVNDQYFLIKELRDEGYYTVNAGKSDWNTDNSGPSLAYSQAAWDENGGYYNFDNNTPNYTYNDPNRNGKPFFAIFNNNTTHMSRMTTVTIDQREPMDVDPATVQLPPHVPDLPETRSDYALQLEGAQDIDVWIGVFLDDLQEKGLLDNTIIFFFSDHGGSLPRGKAFPYATGHRVPLIVYAPDQYKHLLPANVNGRTDRMVSFDDFYPTVLSICGVESPSYVFGKPFMGEYAAPEKDYVHMFRSNTSLHVDPARSVYDGRYHYIRHYSPYKIHALYQSFQWQMPAQLAWDQHFIDGNASPVHSAYYSQHGPEELFDLDADPFAMNNIADDPALQQKLEELRAVTSARLIETQDLGFLSRADRDAMDDQGIVFYDWVRDTNYPVNDLIALAEATSFAELSDLSLFVSAMNSDKPSFRYWGAAGCAHLAYKGLLSTIPAELYTLLADSYPDVAANAATAITYGGDPAVGVNFLIDKFPESYAFSVLEELCLADSLLPELDRLIDDRVLLNLDNSAKGRSLLIKLGELNVSDLFSQSKIDGLYDIYRDRLVQYVKTTPDGEIFVDSIHVSVDGVEPLSIGQTYDMSAVVLPDYAIVKDITWSVNSSSVATVDATTGELTINEEGTVTVTATNSRSGVIGSKTIITALGAPPTGSIKIRNESLNGLLQWTTLPDPSNVTREEVRMVADTVFNDQTTWQFVSSNESDWYYIESSNGKRLQLSDVTDSLGNTDGLALRLTSGTSTGSWVKWKIINAGNNQVHLLNKEFDNYVRSSNIYQDMNIPAYTVHGGPSSSNGPWAKWTLSAAVEIPTSWTFLESSYQTAESKLRYDNATLDPAPGSSGLYEVATAPNAWSGDAVQWELTPVGDSIHYFIDNKHIDSVRLHAVSYIEIKDGLTGLATRLVPNDWNGDNVQWAVLDRGDGSFYLKNKGVGNYLSSTDEVSPAGQGQLDVYAIPGDPNSSKTYWTFDSISGSRLAEGLEILNTTDVKQGLIVYPNPVKRGDILSISYDESDFNEFQLRVFDIQGKSYALNQLYDGGSVILDTRTLEEGIYILEIITKESRKQTKLIVD